MWTLKTVRFDWSILNEANPKKYTTDTQFCCCFCSFKVFTILLISNMLVTGSLHLNYHLETQYSIPLSQLLIVVRLSDHESWTAIINSFRKLLFGDGKLNKWVWCFVNSCWCLIKWPQNSKRKLILQHCIDFETLHFSSQLFCDVTSISLKC